MSSRLTRKPLVLDLIVQYDLETYKFENSRALPAEGFYDAVANSLARSVEKWSLIQKGETNLRDLMHEKLARYWDVTNNTVVVDHNFIKWMVRDFVENEASDPVHALYQCPGVNFHQIQKVIEQDPALVSRTIKSALVQFALRDVVTVVQPGTLLTGGSEMYTTGDDKAFIFVTNKFYFELSGHAMMTVKELLASTLLDAHYARRIQSRLQPRGKDGSFPALSFTYRGKTRNMGRMQKSVVAGDGNCFYRAIATCLNRARDQWGRIKNSETDLNSVLEEHLRRYHEYYNKDFLVIRHKFLRWLVADTLERAPVTHEMFGHFPANKDELVSYVRREGSYGGTIEGIVLHHALRKLVSIVAVQNKDNILRYSEVMSRGDSDKSFMFLLQSNGNHWDPLSHSSTMRFLWKLEELEQIKELPDKCTREAMDGVPDTQYMKYGDGAITVYKPTLGTLFEAVSTSLADHRLHNEWSTAMCSEIRQAYYDFLLHDVNSPKEERFIEFITRKGYHENKGSGDVFHYIERGLNDNFYIHLYDENGPLPRDKSQRNDHVHKTYLVHIYRYDTSEGEKYVAIQPNDN